MKKLLNNTTAYLLKPGRDQLCDEVKEWKSGLEFYGTELSFMRKILDKEFLRISKPIEEKLIEELLNEIKKTKMIVLEQILEKTDEHELDLIQVLEDNDASDFEEKMINEHREIKSWYDDFIEDLKELKLKVYSLVEGHIQFSMKMKNKAKVGSIAF